LVLGRAFAANFRVKYCLLVFMVVVACSDSQAGDDRDAAICVEERRDIPVAIERDLDLLFVVDTSPSMADEADLWATNVTRFVNVLETFEGGLPNMHIGVVSSDVAAGGGLLESTARVQGCTPPNGTFIRDIAYANGEREANYDGELADVLACIALLPPTGGEIEQPLEAMKRALDDSNPENDGFLRDDAFLMVVFVGDEDDCSGGNDFDLDEPEDRSAWRCFADGVTCDQDTSTPGTKTGCAPIDTPTTLTPLDDYDDFLSDLKGDAGMVIVTAVADAGDAIVASSNDGPVLSPSCTTTTTDARPAPRLAAFLERFPQRNDMTTICDQDWVDIFALLAPLPDTILPGICLDGSIDLDVDEPGVQHECQVSEIRFANTDQHSETVLPECTSADAPDEERPCWWIEQTSDCSFEGEVGFRVQRGRESVPGGTTISVRCHAGC
jgi:hypothetical protein